MSAEPLRMISPYPQPEPLEEIELFSGGDYPVKALGSTLSNVAQLLHEVVKAPLGLCAQSVLMAASYCAQGYRNIEIDGREIPLSLFALTIAGSGERKSGVNKWAMAPIKAHEKTLNEGYAEKLADYRLEMTAYKQAESAIKKRLSGEEDPKVINDGLKGLGPPPTKPLSPILIAEDVTAEGLTKHLSSGVPCVAVFTDEGAIFFGGYSMSKEKSAKTIGSYSRLWDAGEASMMRSNEEVENFKIYNRRIAMHLMVQPIIAKQALSDPLLIGQGFIPRFIIASPDSTMGTRTYSETKIQDHPAFKAYFAKLIGLLEKGWHIDPQGGGLELMPLSLQQIAKDDWIRFHDQIEAQLHKTGDYAHISGTAAKIAEQALRIAGVLTVVNKGTGAKMVGLQEMNAAIEIATYSLNQLLALTDRATINPNTEKARMLLNWIADNGLTEFYTTFKRNKRPNPIRLKESFNPALSLLVDKGYLYPLDPKEVDGQFRKEVFKVVSTHEVKV